MTEIRATGTFDRELVQEIVSTVNELSRGEKLVQIADLSSKRWHELAVRLIFPTDPTEFLESRALDSLVSFSLAKALLREIEGKTILIPKAPVTVTVMKMRLRPDEGASRTVWALEASLRFFAETGER